MVSPEYVESTILDVEEFHVNSTILLSQERPQTRDRNVSNEMNTHSIMVMITLDGIVLNAHGHHISTVSIYKASCYFLACLCGTTAT